MADGSYLGDVHHFLHLEGAMSERIEFSEIDPDIYLTPSLDNRRQSRYLLLLIGAGGMVGTLSRYYLSSIGPTHPTSFPTAIFIANLSGAFILGVVVVFSEELGSSRTPRALIGTGFCGGLTTFSTLCLEVFDFLRLNNPVEALLYTALSIAAGLGAVLLAISASRGLFYLKRKLGGER